MKTIGLRYLDGFQCIGAECEDDCCSGWAVTVDEPHYRALAGRLSESEEGKAELQRSVTVQPEGTRRRFALMVLDDRKRCAMLGDDRLCRIHGRFGEELLPDNCAVFPRSSAAVGVGANGRFELSASISCPEIARRCLLVDGATDTFEMSEDRIVRGLIYKAVRGDEGPYQASFDAVRSLFLFLLSQRAVPMATRLGAMAWFADETRLWLHQDATSIDRETMARLFQGLRLPETLQVFRSQLTSSPDGEIFALNVVTEVLAATMEEATPRLVELRQRALGRARPAVLSGGPAEKLELALEAFCKNFVFTDWYIRAPNLTRWLHGLLVRVAILRYLIVAHSLVETQPEQAIVECAYSLSRTLEHDNRSMTRVLDALQAQGMLTLAHAFALITF